jgi:phosphohistidine phosphatase
MRRLILTRHAKSSWAEPGLRDLDRPLNKRGRRATGLIGRWLDKHGYLPDQALVSSARRTQETWAGIVAVVGPRETRYLPELYHAGADTLLDIVQRAPDVPCVLLLGHQPGIGAFATRLLAETPADADFAKYPTGATAVIDFDAPAWPEVTWGTGRLVAFVAPRSLE